MLFACLFARLNRSAATCRRLLLLAVALAGMLPAVAQQAPSAGGSPRQVLVVASKQPAADGLAQEADIWLRYLRASGLPATLVQEDEFKSRLPDAQLLVLPDTRVLSVEQSDAIADFVRNGRSVILTGLAGQQTREGTGTPLALALGLEYRTLAVDPKDSTWVVIDKPGQLSASLPRMQRMSLQAKQPVTLTGQHPLVAFWLIGSAAKPDLEAAAQNPAIIANTYGTGRLIWYGFTLDGLGGDLDSSEAFSRLLRNTLAYLDKRATLEVSPWPEPYQKAMLYSMDVEERFGNMQFVHEIEGLDSITYFILTQSAALHENLLREVAGTAQASDNGATASSGSEIAVLGSTADPVDSQQRPHKRTRGNNGEIAVHGDDHTVFRGQTKNQQLQRLIHAHNYISETVGIPPIGFRPPEEAYDYFTVEALVEAGYKYLLGNNNPDRAVPRMLRVGDTQLVQMTIYNKDDVNLIVQAGYPEPDRVLDNYLRDIDTVFDRGGLYVVNFHSQILATRRYLPVLADIVKYVEKQEAWVTNGRDMYQWWVERGAAHLQVNDNLRGHLHLTVNNTAQTPIDRIALNIWLPEGHRNLRIESPAGGRRVLDYRIDGNKLTLPVPYLRGTENVEFSIRWQD